MGSRRVPNFRTNGATIVTTLQRPFVGQTSPDLCLLTANSIYETHVVHEYVGLRLPATSKMQTPWVTVRYASRSGRKARRAESQHEGRRLGRVEQPQEAN